MIQRRQKCFTTVTKFRISQGRSS